MIRVTTVSRADDHNQDMIGADRFNGMENGW